MLRGVAGVGPSVCVWFLKRITDCVYLSLVTNNRRKVPKRRSGAMKYDVLRNIQLLYPPNWTMSTAG